MDIRYPVDSYIYTSSTSCWLYKVLVREVMTLGRKKTRGSENDEGRDGERDHFSLVDAGDRWCHRLVPRAEDRELAGAGSNTVSGSSLSKTTSSEVIRFSILFSISRRSFLQFSNFFPAPSPSNTSTAHNASDLASSSRPCLYQMSACSPIAEPRLYGSLSGERDLFGRHADSLLQPHFSRYQEFLMIDK
jgi:hypothetical protein